MSTSSAAASRGVPRLAVRLLWPGASIWLAGVWVLVLCLSGARVGAQATESSTASTPREAPSARTDVPLPATLAPTPGGRVGLPVEVPSLDMVGGRPIALRGFWFGSEASAAGAPPARPQATLLILHGCGGAYRALPRSQPQTPSPTSDSHGTHRSLDTRFADAIDLAAARGWGVLVLDSFTARGQSAICQQRIADRSITQRERRKDALGALRWLAARPDVDARRLALVGWSHGGSAVLASIDASHPEVAAAAVRPAWAVAHYPGCASSREASWSPTAPLLILAGQADDWTPVGPCRALVADSVARLAPGVAAPQLIEYPGAFHGFDSRTPVRLRTDVPNGVRPGAGVHVGRDENAAQDARRQLEAWLLR